MKQLSWQTIAMVTVVGGIAVALANLTNWTSSEIQTLIGLLSGLAVGGVLGNAGAGAVAARVDQVHDLNVAQTKTLETVERRTNGELDTRIAASQAATAQAVLDELRRQGVIK